MAKLRLAIFQKDLSAGGIQKSLVNLLNHIDNRKYQVDLYLWGRDDFLKIDNPQVNIIYQPPPSWFSKFFSRPCPFGLQKLFYKNRIKKPYDLAIDYSGYASYVSLAALKAPAQKHVIWVHNDMAANLKAEWRYRAWWRVSKSKFQMFDEVVAVSDGAKQSFEMALKRNNRPIKVVPNYIDAEEIIKKSGETVGLKLDKNCLNLVSLGRLAYQKGFDILLNQMSKAVKLNPKLRLYIIGDGPARLKLEKQITKLKLDRYIVLLGSQMNPYKYMKLMDGFVLTSRFEGQGIAILEAKVLGLPIIIPQHLAGTVEAVRPVADLAKAMAELSKTKHQTSQLADYNKKVLRSFNEVCSSGITKRQRVMFIASTGGHLSELLQLEPIFERYNYSLVTEKDEYTISATAKFAARRHFLRLATRQNLPKYLLTLSANCFISLALYLKLRPQVIISTGAHFTGPMLCIGKLFGSKIVFIESFANINSRSTTGRLVYGFADLFIVQWRELLKLYPRAKYGGWIF